MAAHTGAVRSLEVLDRNGARTVRIRILGPFNPVAGFLVQLVTRFIVSNHQKSLVNNMRKLYARREANCMPDDSNRRLLWRARRDADLVYEGFKKNPVGVPSFLLGGFRSPPTDPSVRSMRRSAAAGTLRRTSRRPSH
jgi:hypothetical protein